MGGKCDTLRCARWHLGTRISVMANDGRFSAVGSHLQCRCSFRVFPRWRYLMARSAVISSLLLLSLATSGFGQAVPDAATLRKEWVDADTGHRVFRLSTENGSESLYFHYNAYSADGKKVVFNAPGGI